ncbi:hypothetical protein FACS1894172_04280 [Spirochaetia bacterium]|nr:hypothetical protein FACS1894172_04280 [Spirochaetia bacterium]
MEIKQELIILSEFKHKNILVKYSQVIKEDIDWFSNTIKRMISNGSIFKNNETMQIGWNFIIFSDLDENTLTLKELDMTGVPQQFSYSIDNTLFHLRLQKDTLESFMDNNNLLFPSLRQSAIICTNFYQTSEFFLNRSNSKINDSGWFFGCTNKNHNHDDPTNLKSESLYTIACNKKQIISFLAFPVDYIITFESNKFKNLFDNFGKKLKIKKGSLLDRQGDI